MISGALALASSLLAAPNASASPAVPIETVFASLQKVRGFHDASISPDGRRAAWSQKVADKDGRERLGAISRGGGLRRALRGDSPPPRTGSPRRELEPVFSPDGSSIAFLSDAAAPGQLQIYTRRPPREAPRASSRR